MTRLCWCHRPVAKDIPDAVLCANHDQPLTLTDLFDGDRRSCDPEVARRAANFPVPIAAPSIRRRIDEELYDPAGPISRQVS